MTRSEEEILSNVIAFPGESGKKLSKFTHVSHNILNGLAALSTDIQALIKHYSLFIGEMDTKAPSSDVKEIAGRIKDAVKIFSSLLGTEVFEQLYERRNDTVLHKHPFSLHATVDQAYEMWSLLATKRGVTCTVNYDKNIPEKVVGDALILLGIVIRVLGVIIQSTAEDTVRLAVHVVSETEENLLLKWVIENESVCVSKGRYQALLNSLQEKAPINFEMSDDQLDFTLKGVKYLIDDMEGEVALHHGEQGQLRWVARIPFGIDNTEQQVQNMEIHRG